MSSGLIDELDAHFNAMKLLLEQVESEFIVINPEEDLALLEQYLVLKMQQLDLAFEHCAARLLKSERSPNSDVIDEAIEASLSQISGVFDLRRNQFVH